MTYVEFEVGHVVRLISGGPQMAVASINGNDIACRWFDVLGCEHTGVFPDKLLYEVAEKDVSSSRAIMYGGQSITLRC